MNRNLVGSIYMYGRFCIKFPQSRMKGEQHYYHKYPSESYHNDTSDNDCLNLQNERCSICNWLFILVIMTVSTFKMNVVLYVIGSNLVGSIYMYGRFCIKFPQSRMKGEQHRLSPLSLWFLFWNLQGRRFQRRRLFR
jgi:hypothetical protein